MPQTSETLWNIYTTNEEAWEAMLEACRNAETTIDLEQFIFVADEIGNRFIEVCAKKASQGVKVRFLWDAAGSFTFFGSSIADDLKKKGIDLVFFKTLFPGFFSIHNYRSWYWRNHRRTLVIDGKIGFTGSMCVSKRMENWRDTNVKIEGPVVEEMQKSFEVMWARAHGRRIPGLTPRGLRARLKDRDKRRMRNVRNQPEFSYVTNSPIPGHHHLYHHLLYAVLNSRKYIYITTPYFVPTNRLFRLLRLAAKRGAEVKIIIPESSDHPIVDLSARTYFHALLKAGAKIYLYQGRMLHSKTIVIDGEWSSVGTLNFDHISLLYNFEANLVTTSKEFSQELSSHFLKDISNAEEVRYRDWKKRFFVEKIVTFLVGLIRGFF